MPPACFIIGTERSGSNLLRMILTSHSRIAVPHPPHLVRYFKPLQARYAGDFGRMVRDARALLETHIYPWDVSIDWARVEAEAEPRDAFGIQYALYDQYAAAKGKARWGCKSTFLVEDVPTLHAHHPTARFLWLVRDPRDVAASSRRSVFSATHPVHAAELWRDQQTLGLRWEAAYPEVVLRLRYEELLAEPEAQVRRVCDALGEVFEPPMLRYFETDEARRSASLAESWKATGEPIRKDNAGRYASVLTAEEIAWVEGICAEPMRALGYAVPDGAAPPRFSAADRARIRREERREDLRIEWRSLRNDRNVWRRWRRAWLLRRIGWRG